MKISKLYSLAIIAFSFLSFNAYGQSNTAAKEALSIEVIQGRVIEVAAETREITLIGLEGNLVTITAGDEVQRFDEIVVNDVISFEYWTYILAEFRNPTSAELAEPLVVVAAAGQAPEGIDPGAVLGEIVKAVVTVEIINRPFMSVTIRGPRGNYITIDVEDTELLEELSIGQVVILTHAEAVAVSLTKFE